VNVTLTEAAATEVKRLVAEENLKDAGLRLSVRGGGCSGFTWHLALDEVYSDQKDHLFEQNGVLLIVDRRFALYADGTTIDFVNDLNKRGFHCSNPSVTRTCGCGSSFAL
jgi:iron-sulfur cluster assembly protein